MRRFLIDQWQQIRGHFKYDLLRTLFGGLVFAAGIGIVNKLRHIPLDWIVLVSIFVFGVVLLLVLGRRQTATVVTVAPPVAANVDLDEKPSAAAETDDLYIELYEPTFISAKMGDLAFRLLEGKYIANGKKAEEAVTDCDLLVELYIVDKSAKKVYIRDFAAWMEIGGVWRRLTLDENFDLDDLWSGSVEYGLEPKGGREGWDEPLALPALIKRRNTEIQPGEPIEGWLKFTVNDI